MNNELNNGNDDVFLKFIKSNLESNAAASPESHAAIRAFAAAEAQRRKVRAQRKRIVSMFAMAASLAVLFGIGIIMNNNHVVQSGNEPVSAGMIASAATMSDDLQIVRVIELLNDSEDFDCDTVDGMDATDILLAWQDAPYNRIEDELGML